MQLCVNWVDGEDNAVPEERATVAELKVLLGGENAAAHEERGEKFEDLFVSVYSLAEGLAEDWWRMLGSRDADGISFHDYRDGYVLPDVRAACDGQDFRVWANGLELENPPVRFAACPEVVYPRHEFEGILTDFIDKVRARLRAKSLKSTSLELSWGRVMASRKDSDEAAFCEAAGALHLDPYAISAADKQFILESAREYKGEALLEFLSDARTAKRAKASKMPAMPLSSGMPSAAMHASPRSPAGNI